ncbi:hypothetical protein GWK47_049371 [Chionoecetes opilio]|uniref:Apoptosis regulatory protein Siva n=1 Tax=Chionoecetes opilio TaxID=41210 RepID=A0A8J5CTB0_CHIOP|nr:hypothetical protein GWK47_049371 [Chionoecetes opilio]
MSKRPCPFEDDLGPLAKVQVGEQGPRRATHSKQVFGEGKPRHCTSSATASTTTTTTTASSPSSMGLQLLLTPQGTLTKPPHDTQHLVVVPRRVGVLSACVWCHRVSAHLGDDCRYCECKLCEGCVRLCRFCGGTFCPKCSLLVYLQEDRYPQDKRVVCLSCCHSGIAVH